MRRGLRGRLRGKTKNAWWEDMIVAFGSFSDDSGCNMANAGNKKNCGLWERPVGNFFFIQIANERQMSKQQTSQRKEQE
jgi:hypothetical protein